ncbi:uncharacterized protein A4U43_C05F33940 [Asparagus officinalis]|uniref:Uncharacterized protein n=1 Tax=Asparagus officinalis TaxID=4686 RepID=A0A5P1F0Z5_ASPOF|nr:uncharacterized protein A4U43_C05F33940 [Asparagus officinalis]
MEVDSIVASEPTKERKLKKMRDDVDVALNDELGTKNKARKGGKAKEVKDLGDEDVEEGDIVNELTQKRIKKKKKKVAVPIDTGFKQEMIMENGNL